MVNVPVALPAMRGPDCEATPASTVAAPDDEASNTTLPLTAATMRMAIPSATRRLMAYRDVGKPQMSGRVTVHRARRHSRGCRRGDNPGILHLLTSLATCHHGPRQRDGRGRGHARTR